MTESLRWENATMRLGDLVEWESNPKRMDERRAETLRVSLRDFGLAIPLLVSPDGLLYDGNQRKAVLDMMEEYGPDAIVDVRITSRPLTPEEHRRLVIYLREAQADWKPELLFQEYTPGELVEYGMEPEEVDAMLARVAPRPLPAPPERVDEADDLTEAWGVEPGQVWRIPSRNGPAPHILAVGDCTDSEVVAQALGGGRAHLIVTSPPYAVGKEYEAGRSFQDHLRLLERFADMALSAVIPGGFVVINFGEIAPVHATRPITGSDRQCVYPISQDYWRIFHVERGCDLYSMRIWYKPFNRLQKPFWTYKTSIPHHQEWEYVWTWRLPGGPELPPQGVPDHSEWSHVWTWRTPGGDGDQAYDWDVSVHAVWDTREEETDDRPLTRHVAAFPIALPLRALRAHSTVGHVVLDPFAGSGTTLLAAERLGRVARLIEREPRYVAVALQRFADAGLMPELDA